MFHTLAHIHKTLIYTERKLPWKVQREIGGTWKLGTSLSGNLHQKFQSSQRGKGQLSTWRWTPISKLFQMGVTTEVIIHSSLSTSLLMVRPIDEDGFTLVPRVGHFHPSHHQTVHTAALTIQVHLEMTKNQKLQKLQALPPSLSKYTRFWQDYNVVDLLICSTSMLSGVPGFTLSSLSIKVPAWK